MSEILDAIEDLADRGQVDEAIRQCQAYLGGRPPEEAAAAVLLLGSLVARTGRLEEAEPLCERAIALARVAKLPAVELEAEVTRASVKAAMGHTEAAIALLNQAIGALHAHPELRWLQDAAVKEREAYRTLIDGPKLRR